MAVAALVVSIIAVIVALGVAVIQHQREIKINQTNLESIYFNEIYMKYLITKIPNARKYIYIDRDGNLRDTEKIIDELNNMRQDSLYYYYNDVGFYDKLKKTCQDLEDYLINTSTTPLTGEDQTEFFNKLKTKLQDIYLVINNKFLGKK